MKYSALLLIVIALFSPVNSVLRSASFHGTRQLGGASSSEEDEELTLSAEEDDYPLPQAPKVLFTFQHSATLFV